MLAGSGGTTAGGSNTNKLNGDFTRFFVSSKVNVIRNKQDLMLDDPPFLISSMLIDD